MNLETKTNTLFLPKEAFEKVFLSLREEFDIFGPAVKNGEGIYTDTDICVYEKIAEFQQLSLENRTYFSAKEIAFPISETILEFFDDEPHEKRTASRKKIIFARACDIEGFLRLDKIFLENGPLADFYYQRYRSELIFFLIECIENFDGCFCQSVDASTTQNYALSLRQKNGGFIITIKEYSFKKWFDLACNGIEDLEDNVEIKLPVQDKVTIPDLSRKDLFKDSLWEEYTKRCIGCGRCNLVCPTCNCFGVYDTMDDKGNYIRKRIWSGCQIDGFAKIAGGHEYRTDKGQRIRYKIMHKFFDFKERAGQYMCTGCGRCIEACPEYIDIRAALEKLNHGKSV